VTWSVYADLARWLTDDELPRVSAALDAILADAGWCMGPNRGGLHEIYFSVTQSSRADAEAAAGRIVTTVLEQAGVAIGFAFQLQLQPGPAQTT